LKISNSKGIFSKRNNQKFQGFFHHLEANRKKFKKIFWITKYFLKEKNSTNGANLMEIK
jgi:hypothetical protein